MDSDGKGSIWFGVGEGNYLGKMDIRTGKPTLYSSPTPNSGPYSVSVDRPRNLVWLSEEWADKIARFDPGTETFIEFSLPTPGNDVRRIEVDRAHPNRVWFAAMDSDKVGYIEVVE